MTRPELLTSSVVIADKEQFIATLQTADSSRFLGYGFISLRTYDIIKVYLTFDGSLYTGFLFEELDPQINITADFFKELRKPYWSALERIFVNCNWLQGVVAGS